MFSTQTVKAIFEPSLPFVVFDFPPEDGQELNPRKQLVLDWLIPNSQRYFRTPDTQAEMYTDLMTFLRKFIEGPVAYDNLTLDDILKNVCYFSLMGMGFQTMFQHGDNCWVLNEVQGNNHPTIPTARTIVHRLARNTISAALDSNSEDDMAVFDFLSGTIPLTRENFAILLDGLDEFANAAWTPLPADA